MITVPATAQQRHAAPPARGEDVYEKVSPSVVKITVFAKDGSPLKTGSGVVVDTEGSVLTNFHVVEGGTFFELTRSAKRTPISTPARPIMCAQRHDIAILQAANSEGLRPPKIAVELPRVGSRVFALGAPLALESTFSDGIVSQIRQSGAQTLIQTTAPISPGSSGGGLFSEKGELLGITTEFLEGGQALNFAVAIRALNETRGCSAFGEPILTAEARPGRKFVTYEGVRVTTDMSKDDVLSRLGDRVTLSESGRSEKGIGFWVHKRGSKSAIGHIRFKDGRLTSASQLYVFGDSQFDFASLLYKILLEMAPEGDLAAHLSLTKSKDIEGWSILIAAPEGQVRILMVDTDDSRTANIQKDVLAN